MKIRDKRNHFKKKTMVYKSCLLLCTSLKEQRNKNRVVQVVFDVRALREIREGCIVK